MEDERMTTFHTLTEMLDARSAQVGTKIAFTFISTLASEETTLSYADLQVSSKAVAASLQQRIAPGKPVLFQLPTGSEFVTTFFGCLYAGLIPVPLPLLQHKNDRRNLRRVRRVLAETRAAWIVGSAESRSILETDATFLQYCTENRVTWMTPDELENASSASDWKPVKLSASTPAYLQFTSGSTLDPRGVVLTHGNILANLEAIQAVFQHTEQLRGVGWLPLYHDMGLVGHVLQPLFVGGSSVLMPPSSFVRNPLIWLQAISHYRATTSGAPLFAYELCLRKWKPGREELDLSTWENAYVGAETVHADTLAAFATTFAPHGFREENFLPCYGLAEATLFVAGSRGRPVVKQVDRTALSQGRVVTVVNKPHAQNITGYACHQAFTVVEIRDPETGLAAEPGQVGEVWVAGPSVAAAYWQNPNASRETFYNEYDEKLITWMRTGDLGFVEDEHLFVNGRLKDLIIIRGENHYPQDLEKTVAAAHAVLRTGTNICFAVADETSERLVIVQEGKRSWTANRRQEIFTAMRGAIADQHGLSVSDIVLIANSSLPRTSSGKLARTHCRNLYHQGKLEILDTWSHRTGDSDRSTGMTVADVQPIMHKNGAQEETVEESIAIIGMACKFPGADDPESLWQILMDGVDVISEVPPQRWNWQDFYDPRLALPGKMNTRWGGFLKNVDLFDPDFFGISPHEAAEMDPQQRLLLEVVWRAFENAGLTQSQLTGSDTGVFVGISTNDYMHMQIKLKPGLECFNAYSGLGNANSISANRVSYTFDLRGPSVAVDTACSSSLTALHLAAKSIRDGEASVAVAGGVNLILSPGTTITLSQFGMMAPDGRCKVFDAAADGYVRSEGCGIVVLKKTSAALRDGDNILAIIRGSAIGQDGRSQGLTAPNGEAQRWVIEKALQTAVSHPTQISYIEAHGTGTAIGDPVEMEQLAAVYGAGHSGSPCYVGSIKASLGHLEASAGIAGVIKLVLALQHRQIPPQLHLKQLNPRISLAQSRLAIAHERTDWHASGTQPRQAAISSFGFGGANVHMILEEWPGSINGRNAPPSPVRDTIHILPLAARSAAALRTQAAAWLPLVAASDHQTVAALCYSQATRRTHYPQRTAFVADSPTALQQQLQKYLAAPNGANTPHTTRNIAFLFTGQGAQFAGMGHTLYTNHPVFRTAFDRCALIFDEEQGKGPSLAALIWPADTAHADLLHETLYTQPVLFAFEFALAELWRSWGITPQAVLGHSLGEYVAAVIAGCMSPEDGMRLVMARARLMDALPVRGGMAAVFASADQVQAILDAHDWSQVTIAAINSPHNTVLSGTESELEAALSALEQAGLSGHHLQVSHAFHSPLMDEMLDLFTAVAAQISFSRPQIMLISNVTGQQLTQAPDAAYWRQHVRHCVDFHAGMQALTQANMNTFLEIGPGRTLISLGQSCLNTRPMHFLLSLNQSSDARQTMLETASKLFEQGFDLEWENIYAVRHPYIAAIPGHPYNRKRYWFAHDETAVSFTSPTTTSSPKTLPAQTNGAPPIRFNIRWVPDELPPLPNTGAETDKQVNWIIFGDGNGLTHEMAKQLHYRGEQIFWISREISRWRRGFQQKSVDRETGAYRFIVPPGCGKQTYFGMINYILKKVSHVGAFRWRVLYLGGFDATPVDQTSIDSLMQDQALHGAGDFVALVQALIQTALVLPIWIVTRQAEAVHIVGEQDCKDVVNLAQTPLWGLGRTFFLEHPEMRGGIIDLDNDTTMNRQAEQLIAQIAGSTPENQVAFRRGQRYIAQLFPSNTPDDVQPLPAHKDGSYLITGGLGGLGLQCAQLLAERGAGHIILVGRTGLPPRQTWATIQVEDKVYAKVEAIRVIEAAGATVSTFAVDVTDPDQLAALFHTLSSEAPPLRGLIHAAGVNWFGKIAELNIDELLIALKVNVSASWHLHQLTKEMSLDFFVLFSSVSALWGSVDLGHYTASNHFLDALSHYRRHQTEQHALSINWGPWADVGMSSYDQEVQVLTKLGFRLMAPQVALDTLAELTVADVMQCVVTDIDWPRFRSFVNFSLAPSLFAHMRSLIGEEDDALQLNQEVNKLKTAVPAEAHAMLLSLVQKQLATVMLIDEIEKVDIQQRFNFMGMDSLMAIAFAARLENIVGQRLPTMLAYRYPTIQAVVDHLYELVRGEKPEGIVEAASATAKTTLNGASAANRNDVPTATEAWFPYLSSNDQARFRLYCFPYAGAGASAYLSWLNALAPWGEVVPVQLPGREERLAESPLVKMDDLVQRLADALATQPPIPFGFWGHSLGAIISYKLACELRRRLLPLPEHLILSAAGPGGISSTEGQMPADGNYLHYLDQIAPGNMQNEVLRTALLPILRADVALLESCVPVDKRPLSCPITVFGGRNDTLIKREHLLAWGRHTEGAFSLQLFSGNHLFIKEQESILLPAIRQALANQADKEVALVRWQ